LDKFELPTGYLIVDDYCNGKLETLSIGDYGKDKNVKADFLGLKNEINGVSNGNCLPLSQKWVITLSTQYGCVMNCSFCDVPNIKFKGNVSFDDLYKQFQNGLNVFYNQKYVERLNVHFARMGEPIFNDDVFKFSEFLYKNKYKIQEENGLRIEVAHPVLSTSCPKTCRDFESRLLNWCEIKNGLYNGQAGLQLSINSTNEKQRDEMFNGKQIPLKELSEICKKLPDPLGRKYCLNFAYANDFEIDGELLSKRFSPDKFMCKITPIHNNVSCKKNNIQTVDGYKNYLSYIKPENELKKWGFDVLVFVPSLDEENGLVTCGNAILSGSKLKKFDGILKITGLNC
jgi:23S rRNA (adenine2503-C2)-methyltransferase